MSEPASHEIVAPDGGRIAARFFAPQGEPAGAVLIAPAMGALQDYYASFALWLAERGFLVATFDYRGMGRSRPRSLRGFRADLFDWARLDCAAMVEALASRAPGRPLYWIGHSLGGQILPLVPNRERVAKIVTVACGSGYWLVTAHTDFQKPEVKLFCRWLLAELGAERHRPGPAPARG